MDIEARWQGDMHFTCTAPSQHTIELDSGKPGTTHGPSPTEVLLQAVACCTGMDIVVILEKKRKTPDDFVITVSGERAETHPKKFTAIAIHYTVMKNGLTENELKQAIDLSINKYCSVVASFALATKITWGFTLKN